MSSDPETSINNKRKFSSLEKAPEMSKSDTQTRSEEMISLLAKSETALQVFKTISAAPISVKALCKSYNKFLADSIIRFLDSFAAENNVSVNLNDYKFNVSKHNKRKNTAVLEERENLFLAPPFKSKRELIFLNSLAKRQAAIPETEFFTNKEIETKTHTFSLHVHKLLSNGASLATTQTPTKLVNDLLNGEFIWFFFVPSCLENETITATVWENNLGYSICDLVSIDSPNPNRITPKCKYFGKCSGCQFQMLEYNHQLDIKTHSVLEAFQAESPLIFHKNLRINPTLNSPNIFGYRTKITPHFDLPNSSSKSKPRDLSNLDIPIGFNYVNKRLVLDIEDCAIAADPVNSGLLKARSNTKNNISKFKRGATLLIREKNASEPQPIIHQTQPLPLPLPSEDPASKENFALDPNEMISEYVWIYNTLPKNPHSFLKNLDNFDKTLSDKSTLSADTSNLDQSIKSNENGNGNDDSDSNKLHLLPIKFTYKANSFFQNNNSILPKFVHFVRSEIHAANNFRISHNFPKISYLVDAYCGAGLFALACSRDFINVVGIEISKDSILNASENAKQNNITNCQFIQGDASNIFSKIDPSYSQDIKPDQPNTNDQAEFSPLDPNQTAVIIDPPRKGSNPEFLKQLVAFAPACIIYVACGVPAQARDLQFLAEYGAISLDNSQDSLNSQNPQNSETSQNPSSPNPATLVAIPKYKISTIQPFDLFPQSYHVENIIKLNTIVSFADRVKRKLVTGLQFAF
ncbi:hypothetical protein BB560_004649 [Smittium megazygosporum]|uniref:TRAM domain-containing protein n=1 Tax=Smittium megazygosporum TaxID=133381 RepID=A0A2T9Z8P4_9FUNG|nr:hypothetical protein BB560_004649 [Smittium megazygosporum]